MKNVDYGYLARSMERLFGIPVRVYEGERELFRFFPAPLPRDPMELCRKELFAVTSHVGYYCTSVLFHCYGILNTEKKRFIVGPTARITAEEQQLKALAFRLDVPREEIPAFVEGMRGIQPLPAETVLQMLCTVNHLLNGETLELSDVAIYDDEQTLIKSSVEKRRTAIRYDADPARQRAHNTLAIEEALLGIVRKGDTAALKRWLSQAPAVQGGIIAADQLRQQRNLFIVTTTLVSRAAIGGGMREDEAFSLSDAYIQRAELLTSFSKIMNLQYNMILEFTEQVEKLQRGTHKSKLALDVANYVRRHLSEPISVEDMAEEFFLSRPYLSAKFKRETGQTLTDFILREKTEEAKRLLRYSDKPQAAISAYLGFSSQGHFAKVFKKYAGCTPNEYREKQG